MTLDALNQLASEKAIKTFLTCCHSSHWANLMEASRPFSSQLNLITLATENWAKCSEEDGLEAFLGHPKIGDIKSLAKKYSATEGWSSGEQSGVENAQQIVLEALAQGNADYEEKFGFIFIVCATGKTAGEMLGLLEERLPHDRKTEIDIAMGEQLKITHIRLNKLLA